MRRRRLGSFLHIVLFCVPLIVSAVAGPARAGAATKLRVVATVGDLGALAREVLGDAGEVTVLAKPTQDPHFVDARPNLILSLNRADALISMGLEYEIGWLPVLVRGARNAKLAPGGPGDIVASTMVAVQEIPTQRIDRSMGDIHPGGNPHFTLDPRNAIKLAEGIAARFTALASGNGPTYQKNAAALVARLTAREKKWQAAVAGFRGSPVVTYHRSFIYLTSWLGLVETDTLEPKPGIPPNAAHLGRVIEEMRARKVPLILQERWYPSSVAEQVASQTGARLVLIPGMTAEGARYDDHIDEIVSSITSALAAAKNSPPGGTSKP
jgi:zinc/manganese transport system substrate-binding protein